MSVIDGTTDVGKRLKERLGTEEVIWLVFISADGTPQPTPVWFLDMDDDMVLMFSQPNTPKIRAIQRNNRVALHFNSAASGDDIGVLLGSAEVWEDGPSVTDVTAYVAKYADAIKKLGMTPDQMGAEYSLAVRIRVDKVRGW